MLDVVWRPRAHLDKESIALYLGYERQSPEAALAAIRSIDAAIERIRAFPDSGGRFVLDGLENREYRTTHANPYTIYYRVDEEKLIIYRILHQRRNIDTYELIDFPVDSERER